MPTLFIGHGSPMNALEDNPHTRAWRKLREQLPKPRAILAISAHWFSRGTQIAVTDRPATLHDFHGFPPALYECEYPAPGAPELAGEIRELLQPLKVGMDEDWGLDHGTWSILMHMYPQAEIPTLQLSIDATKPAEFHYELGRQLRPLRDRGVLILASGNVVHNLAQMTWGERIAAPAWADNFNTLVKDALARGDHQSLIHYPLAGHDARLAVPTPEHFLPLLYVAGASSEEDTVTFPTDGIELGTISMLSVMFNRRAAV
ncbi:Aromatic ring-opening dioxygenase, catalytic subunit, LigB family [Microbulbifer donghaiensis]|uniref:Aromatic ring-opening dioxygenase, catalytic subunit, LigB family n=2 Tax=Microbulbifer donghaiensis TaxID=494016 RepID=A0A1M4UKH8_9GAMM|nr:Aromatic ring-opening dioxygenase, catalytic subunit, LigB family [Microbulbifer donghaiensis]